MSICLAQKAWKITCLHFYRKWLKEKILNALPHLKSSLQENRRKSAVLYSPEACEESMVRSAMETHGDEEDNMQTIYRAAQVIRKSIANFTKAAKDTNTIEVTSDIHDVPAELYTAIRWIMIGPADILETQRRINVVNRAALTVSQNIMYGFKSNRQVNCKPRRESAAFRPPHARENPQVLGLALQDPQLDSLQNGYHIEFDGQLKPSMTDALPAPKAIIEMVSCQCKTDFFCQMFLQNKELILH